MGEERDVGEADPTREGRSLRTMPLFARKFANHTSSFEPGMHDGVHESQNFIMHGRFEEKLQNLAHLKTKSIFFFHLHRMQL